MGAWMLLPCAEEVIAERVDRFWSTSNRKGGRRRPMVSRCSDLLANPGNDPSDIANLDDFNDEMISLWACETPSTDDGF